MSSKHECGSIAAERCPNEEKEESAASAGAVVVPNTSCCFSVLPREILQTILLDFVDRNDKRSLVRLASCNKFLQRLVYREFSSLWERIDLKELPRINDSQLRPLLERVNARHVTKHISCRWGLDISGSGLVPLMNSKVLESADLRLRRGKIDVGPTGLDDSLVASIFQSMLPYKLDSIKLSPQEKRKQDDYGALVPFGEYCTPWAELLKRLHLKKGQKLLKEQVPCSHCGRDLLELFPCTQTILNACSAQCSECKEATCRVWNASTSLCPTTQECDSCLNAFCQSCRPVLGCRHCGTKSCTECREDIDCSDCGVAMCTNGSCGEVPCYRCAGRYCDDCRCVKECYLCEEMICEVCEPCMSLCCEGCMSHVCRSCLESQGGRCLGCDLIVGCCLKAEDVIQCNKCGATDDGIVCVRCSRSIYYQPSSLRKCGGCSKRYCGDCNRSCMSCGKTFCYDCEEKALSCGECEEVTCKRCLEANDGILKCDACQKLCVVRCYWCLREHDRRAQTDPLLCIRCSFVCDPCACEKCGELLCRKDRDRFRNTCDDSYCCALPAQDKHDCSAEPNGQTPRRKKKKVI